MRRLWRLVTYFWRTLLEEGLYGALDALSFAYLNDRYVPHHRITGCFYPNGCGQYGHDLLVDFRWSSE